MSAIASVSAESDLKREWFHAVQSNDMNRVEALLGHEFLQNTLNEENWSALHMAAWNGFEVMIQLLISAGCDLDIGGQDGSTPLTLASQKGHVEVVKKLLLSGCNVHRTAALGDCQDVTALHLAAQHGNRSVVEALIKGGAMVGATMSVRDITGVTPLHLAVQAGHLDVIEVLLASGVDVNTSTRPASESDV